MVEAWLPDQWNRRFLATGGGGIGGCIDYPTIRNGASLGFASFGTNGGHNGSEGFDFFLNQPEVLKDFGYRAIHVEAEVGKEIVRAYYGRRARHHYYAGCSTGGRQGFQAALLYPDDFDGVLAGSPGVDWLRVVSSKGILAHRIGWPNIDSDSYVREAQWNAIVEAQIRLLDPLDGVKDGIIDNPTMYRFDPEILACGTGVLNDSVCLQPAQIDSVRSAYEPIADSTGKIVYPSWELGANTDVFSKNINATTGEPDLSYTILEDFFRGAVYNSSAWTPTNFTTNDMDFALKVNPGQVNTDGTDLSAFRAKGGKLIAYHGRNDESVTSALSAWHFSGTQSSLNASLAEMHDFYRLFYIPGMHHCSGGPGAWDIGQMWPLGQGTRDSQHNLLLALVAWVEEGRKPDSVIGTKFHNDVVADGIEAQRTHCVYPRRSVWDGKGDTRRASSWKCI
ncbi:hypothetical protein PRZ48_003957 [Zasmidium cellare]|uniref:Carboxylic ester hydrolase n=1 Tax=Zasmidium cellare TaxID=395010 RepID=A0ABR0EWI9_ZASCE|nr:hypothetical protein PRZ48_003957 [Zasmidium cellare]